MESETKKWRIEYEREIQKEKWIEIDREEQQQQNNIGTTWHDFGIFNKNIYALTFFMIL